MDDGHKLSNLTYNIATCSFTEDEHIILIQILLNNFKIQAKIFYVNKKYPILIISKKFSNNDSHIIFKNLIKPFIITSMEYKL